MVLRTGTSDRVICLVTEIATGRTVVQAGGRPAKGHSATTIARKNALKALKKQLGRPLVVDDYLIQYCAG